MLIQRTPLFIILFIFFSATVATSQNDNCGTIDSKDTKFEELIIQSKVPDKSQIEPVPITLHVFRTNSGVGGLSMTQWPSILEDLNADYGSVGITFYQCGNTHFIDSSDIWEVTKGGQTEHIAEIYNVPNTINIYVPNQIMSGDNSICGFAKFPWALPDDHIYVKTSCMNNSSTLAHELGHYFGVYHTHTTTFGNDLVDGSSCSFRGDRHCDTPADPKLGSDLVNSSCEYTGTETDSNGDQYEPDPTNIMSYSLKQCRTRFSDQQATRLLQYRSETRDYLACQKTTSTHKLVRSSLIRIEPNPSDGNIRLERIDNSVDLIEYTLSDLNGRVLRKGSFQSNQISLMLNEVPGTYFLNLRSDKMFQSSKVVLF